MIELKFQPLIKLCQCFYLFIISICIVILVTLSHEVGHFIAAKLCGYNTVISYNKTSFKTSGNTFNPIKSISTKNINIQKFLRKQFFCSLGGPLITTSAGLLGIFLLFLSYRKDGPLNNLSFKKWILIFLSMFWARSAFILILTVFYLVCFKIRYICDEVILAGLLNLPWFTFSMSFGILSIIIICIIIIKIIPLNNRLTFILSFILGGTVGYYLWFNIIGKVIL